MFYVVAYSNIIIYSFYSKHNSTTRTCNSKKERIYINSTMPLLVIRTRQAKRPKRFVTSIVVGSQVDVEYVPADDVNILSVNVNASSQNEKSTAAATSPHNIAHNGMQLPLAVAFY